MNDKSKTGVKLNLRHKIASNLMNSATDDTLLVSNKKTPAEMARDSMKSNLTLDQESLVPAKTRNELYKELSKDDKVWEEEDYFEFANPVFRGIAFVIDAAFAVTLVKCSMLLAPLEAKVWHLLFLDRYKLQFVFGEEAMVTLIMYLSVFLALFFFIVIPVSFFNVSLGKKLMKIRVRGDNRYTLSITQAFQRELIFKPLSVVLLVGFILPFFDKKKKSLHDKMAGTFVVSE